MRFIRFRCSVRGFRDKPIRPNAVEDVARIVEGFCLGRSAFPANSGGGWTGGVEACRSRSARGAGGGSAPAHVSVAGLVSLLLGWCLERMMNVPMVSARPGPDPQRGIGRSRHRPATRCRRNLPRESLSARSKSAKACRHQADSVCATFVAAAPAPRPRRKTASLSSNALSF